MPTTPARELVVSWGSYAASPDGHYRLEKTFERFSLDFAFIVTGSTDASFARACRNAEDAYRKPFQDLQVKLGSQVIFSAKQSLNSGLELRADIRLDEHQVNTGRSRRYLAHVEGGLPADNVTDAGLRSFTVDVGYSPARRRRVVFRGIYTASSSQLSRAQYEANIAAKCSAVLSVLSGTFELAEEPTTEQSYHDQELRFQRVYDELIYSQAGTADDSAIVRQEFSLSMRRASDWYSEASYEFGGISGKTTVSGDPTQGGQIAQPLMLVEATYSAWIDKTVTQDLPTKWASIRTWVVTQMKTLAATSIAVTEDRPTYHYDDNRITATISGFAVGDSRLLRRNASQMLETMPGKVLVPVWNGDPYGRYVYAGPATKRRTTSIEWESVQADANNVSVVAGAGGAGVAGVVDIRPGGDTGPGWTNIDSQITKRDRVTSLKDGTPLKTAVTTLVVVDEYANILKPLSPQAGSVSITSPTSSGPITGQGQTANLGAL